MQVGPGFVVSVGQIRVCIETVEAIVQDHDTKNIESHYKGCRGKMNAFIDQYTSSAPLNVCLQDIKSSYTMESIDTLPKLVLRISFEEEIHAIIVCLKDVNETTNTMGLIQKRLGEPYTLINAKSGYAFEGKNLDVDVYKMLEKEEAPFGYILCIKQPKTKEHGQETLGEPVEKKIKMDESPQEKNPQEKNPQEKNPQEKNPQEKNPQEKNPQEKKRRKLVVPKRKAVTGEVTSEESTHK